MEADLDQLGDAEFESLARLVEATCGIRLPQGKRIMCEGRLRRRARVLHGANLDAYAALVPRTDGREQELPYLIDAITTNKTDFFREPAHFEALQDRLVPCLIGLRRHKPVRLKIWSAACSIGAEAFSAAMVLQDLQAARGDFHYSILGTDISADVLERARAAIYPRGMADQIQADRRGRYVMHAASAERDEVRIVPELRQKVNFKRLNLVGSPYPVDDDVDVIFCRNVLIYFDRPRQEAVVRQLASHLRPGGFLLLGHSESMTGACADRLRPFAPTIYRADD